MTNFILFLVSVCLSFFNRVVSSQMISCAQTPYPRICDSLLGDNNNNYTPFSSLEETRFGFRDLALRATIERAEEARRLASAVDLGSLDHQGAKLAWHDCMELMEDTVSHLNHSHAASSSRVSDQDTQTWLSAAITNYQTCQNGFMELNASSYLPSFPLMSGNFSKFLSNSLAINKMASVSSPTLSASDHSGGGRRKLLASAFPDWVSPADRRLLQSSGAATRADIVVAKDGSGKYRTISEALAAAEKMRSGSNRFVIYVKSGVYSENVEVKKTLKNLMIIGDGIDSTVVTGKRSVKDGSTTFRSATFAVTAGGFIAQDITFENTAGPQKGQAVALRSGSDLSVFYRCSFKGYQDTLYVYSQRQFYRDCDVYGTVDFIFGDAVTVLQNCNIYLRRPMSGQRNTITAQGRSDPNENTGISIHNSRVTAASDLRPVQGSFKSYLGRPWQKYSRTVFIKCSLDSLIAPAGWLEWSGSFALSTLYYGEYMNTGPGAGTGGRVKWPGYRVISNGKEAGQFTAGSFLSGNSWIPSTGIPFTSGL